MTNESTDIITVSIHILGIVTNIGVLSGIGLLLKHLNIYSKMKERVNHMWRQFCLSHDMEYKPLGKED